MEQVRTCVITREVLDTNELIRFVASPDGILVPDVAKKLPGRGIWLKAERKLLADGKTAKTLKARASAQVKQKLELLCEGEELADLIEGQLKTQALNRIGLMRAAGQVVTGFEKTASAIRGEKLAVLIEAEDAKSDGVNKLQSLTRGLSNEISVVDVFGRDELSKALGGENTVHAALMDRGLAKRFLTDTLRLYHFQGKAIRRVGGAK